MRPARSHGFVRLGVAASIVTAFGCSQLAGVDYSDAYARDGGRPEPLPAERPKLVANGYQTALLTREGTTKWWGSTNPPGPAKAVLSSARPIEPFGELTDLHDVATSDTHTCVLTNDGRVFCLGKTDRASRGFGWPTSSKAAAPIEGIDVARRIFGGAGGACASLRDSRLTCWGDDTIADRATREVPGVVAPDDVAIGEHHACALERGTVKCWGDNGRGQLGRGSRAGGLAPHPVSLPGPASIVTAGELSSCAIVQGDLYCWGARLYPRPGSATDTDHLLPTRVALAESIASVSVFGHACAVGRSGRVWCWGSNDWAATGHAPDLAKEGFAEPLQVDGAPVDAVEVVVGRGFSCVRTRSERVNCWGFAEFGSLGRETAHSKTTGWEMPGYAEGL